MSTMAVSIRILAVAGKVLEELGTALEFLQKMSVYFYALIDANNLTV